MRSQNNPHLAGGERTQAEERATRAVPVTVTRYKQYKAVELTMEAGRLVVLSQNGVEGECYPLGEKVFTIGRCVSSRLVYPGSPGID